MSKGLGFISDGYHDGSGSGTGDMTPPVVTSLSPVDPAPLAIDYTTARFTPAVVKVRDEAPGLAYVAVFALLPGWTEREVVYRGAPYDATGFEPGFDVLSTVAWTDDPRELHVSVVRNGGWPPGVFELTTDAVDAAGNPVAVP